MEAPLVTPNTRVARSKTLALVALAVVGTFAACYLCLAPASTQTNELNPTMVYDLYTHWKQSYGLKYGGPEDKYRFQVFTNNYQTIVDSNNQKKSYELGLNQFASLTQEEFSAIYLGYQAELKPAVEDRDYELFDAAGVDVPNAVDWETAGKITPVKNQGQCGSCWAFSTTGAVEGRLAIATGNLVSLSEQQLVDCAGSYGNQGCNGGLMDNAFQYVRDNGLVSEADYPYKGVDGRCNIPATAQKYKIANYRDVSTNNPDQLVAALATGPVSVAIEADTSAFQFYKSGVLTDDACGTQLDHGVLAVGYGTENGVDYFKVKNSWGASWGRQGYVYLQRKAGAGECGIQEQPSYPVA